MSPLAWIDNKVSALSFWHLGGLAAQPPAARDFEQLEELVGGELPVEYRRFVTHCGAAILGDLHHQVVAPLLDKCPWGPLIPMEFVYPAVSHHPDSAARQIRMYRGVIPSGLLPVMEYANRKVVCLDVGGKFPGSVWMWRTSGRGEAPSSSSPAWLSASFPSPSSPLDRPREYTGLYRMALTFGDLLRSARRVPY